MASKKEKIIFINGKFLFQPITGVQRYAYQLILGLDDLLESNINNSNISLKLLVPKGYASKIKKLERICVIEIKAPFGFFFWEQVQLPIITWGRALLNLTGSAPLFKKNQYCTIHDAAVFDIPSSYTRLFIVWYKFLFSVQSKICTKFFTVSEFSRARLSYRLKVDPIKFNIINNASDHFKFIHSDKYFLEKLGIKNKKYFLTVGSSSPTKNIDFLFKSFLKLKNTDDIILVLVGDGNGHVFNQMSNSNNMSEPKLMFTGRVDDHQLKALYSGAIAFIFPSLYEGFGIPPLEAMICNCPVLASNRGSIPEICGNAAAYFDPTSEVSLSNALSRALIDNEWLDGLKEAGVVRIKNYSWRISAIKLYESLLNK
jgi:glycosyltransferase involved in cell wall biosynthesis